MRDFDWNLIKSFLAVIDHQTLMSAAKELSISQPTLGRHITDLEQTTGLVLFDRSRNGMRPTQAALILAAQARDMQRDANAFALAASARDEQLEGTVRITASQVVANFILPDIIAKFSRLEPGIQIELVPSNNVQNLLARDADIALRMTRPMQNDTIMRKATDMTLGTYAHKDYLKNAPPLENTADLKNHKIIGFDRDNLIIQGLAAGGIDMVREDFAVRTDDQVAYIHLLFSGIGIGFAANIIARKNNALVRILEEIPISPLPIWLVSHHELKTNPRIRRTMDYLFEEIKALNFT